MPRARRHHAAEVSSAAGATPNGEKVFAIVGQIRQGRGPKRGTYASQKVLIRSTAPRARDVTNQRMRIGGEIDEAERSKNRNKSKVRAR